MVSKERGSREWKDRLITLGMWFSFHRMISIQCRKLLDEHENWGTGKIGPTQNTRLNLNKTNIWDISHFNGPQQLKCILSGPLWKVCWSLVYNTIHNSSDTFVASAKLWWSGYFFSWEFISLLLFFQLCVYTYIT